jgi:hypothetical protein
MSTRSGKSYQTMNKSLGSKHKPKNIENLHIQEECSICTELLDLKTPETTLTNCNHKFHTSCINSWINTTIATANTCPLCRTPINPDQLPQQQQPQQQQFQQFQYHHQPQIPEHERRLQQVIALERRRNTPVPFLGVVICYNDRIIKRYLNTYFNLTTDSTLSELKGFVLSDQEDIIRRLPSDHVCTFINTMSTISRGFIERRTRQIQITDTHFTNSSECSARGISSIQFNYDNGNITLGNLYGEYQQAAALYTDNILIKHIYDNYVERWDRTGPDDPGRRTTDFFLDPYGFTIPEQFRARQEYENSSLNSIAWLCFTIDCVRMGGKTRKNKKQKKTKKRNSQFLKRERTNNKRRKTRKTRI